jgi:hypothetical protein
MGTFQTLLALVMLIFALSVAVQAVQELLKSILNTKASVMRDTIIKFMGNHLTLEQVRDALVVRGLDITALEAINKDEFRHLLDGVQFQDSQLQGIVVSTESSVEKVKDNIAASYDAARVSFQKAYTRRNKIVAIVLSALVVLLLNANLIVLYESVSADQAAQQAIVGKAGAGILDQSGANNADAQTDIGAAYLNSRVQLENMQAKYPILLRTFKFGEDFHRHPYILVPGLVIMILLVSLGAPFWNDILKGMMGINNTLNSSARRGL